MKWDEWKQILAGIGYGIASGIGFTILLGIYNGLAPTWNCFCEGFSCHELKVPVFDYMAAYIFVAIVAFAIPFLVKLFSAVRDANERLDDEHERRIVRNCADTRERYTQVYNLSKKTSKEIKGHIASVEYHADKLQEDLDRQCGIHAMRQNWSSDLIEKYKV